MRINGLAGGADLTIPPARRRRPCRSVSRTDAKAWRHQRDLLPIQDASEAADYRIAVSLLCSGRELFGGLTAAHNGSTTAQQRLATDDTAARTTRQLNQPDRRDQCH
jgi:hypothetical protein